MYIYRTSKQLLETHTAKYKPSTQFLPHKKFSVEEKFPQNFTWKNLYFCCIRYHKCIQIFLHELHLHETLSHVFISRLKAGRFSAFLICGGSLFHIFGPRTLKLFSPNFTWLALTTFKFRFCWLRTGLSDDLNWCRGRDLFESQILVTTRGFELQISSIRSRSLTTSYARDSQFKPSCGH